MQAGEEGQGGGWWVGRGIYANYGGVPLVEDSGCQDMGDGTINAGYGSYISNKLIASCLGNHVVLHDGSGRRAVYLGGADTRSDNDIHFFRSSGQDLIARLD
jgi:hypothetical protein